MKCDYCIRRARHVGGNESCPVFHRAERQVFAAAGSMKMRTERATAEEAWPNHLRVYPSGCASFKPGDLRAPAPPSEQEVMF